MKRPSIRLSAALQVDLLIERCIPICLDEDPEDLPMARSRESSDLKVTVSAAVKSLGYGLAQLLIIQLAFVGGLVAFHFDFNWQTPIQGNWRFVLIVMAAISIGFGAAVLLYQRLNQGNAERLKSDYDNLVLRADDLLMASRARLGERDASTDLKR
jgi:hypothetical protein